MSKPDRPRPPPPTPIRGPTGPRLTGYVVALGIALGLAAIGPAVAGQTIGDWFLDGHRDGITDVRTFGMSVITNKTTAVRGATPQGAGFTVTCVEGQAPAVLVSWSAMVRPEGFAYRFAGAPSRFPVVSRLDPYTLVMEDPGTVRQFLDDARTGATLLIRSTAGPSSDQYDATFATAGGAEAVAAFLKECPLRD